MDHKPSSVMTDRDGQFQRCWDCGARRRIAALGAGIWNKGRPCGEEEAPTSAIIRQSIFKKELVDELFKQT